jgi:hypothetical protein
MSLVSPAGDEMHSFARRRTDGSYAAGIVSAVDGKASAPLQPSPGPAIPLHTPLATW